MPLATMLQPFPARRGGGGGGRGGEALGGLLAGPGVELAPPAREQVAELEARASLDSPIQ